MSSRFSLPAVAPALAQRGLPRPRAVSFRTLCGWFGLYVLAGLCSPAWAQAPANAFDYERKSSFSYRADGLLQTETIEPDNPAQAVQTTHSYDAYGNKAGATTANLAGASGRAVFAQRSGSVVFAAQTVIVNGSSAAIPAGTFATLATNALGHTETRSHDPRFGAVTQLTGPNGLSTQFTVDDFGRVIKELRADGTSTVTEHCIIAGKGLDTSANTAGCGSTAPLSGLSDEILATAVSYVQAVALDVAQAPMGPVARVYKDRAGRTVREVAEVALTTSGQPTDRRWVVRDVEYSATGVAVLKTQPYFLGPGSSTVTGSNDVGFEMSSVDALGRPVRVDVADAQGNVAGVSFRGRSVTVARTIISYSGLNTTTVNPKGQRRIEEKNVDGKLVRVADAYSAQLAHQHDAFGNLVRTKDALGNLVSISYDVRGRKLSMNDPDTGLWKYDYNALGELVWQESPNQRVAGTSTTMAYDALGRLVQRVEPEYTSTWTFDNCTKGVGKLCATSTTHGVSRKFVFDSLGRPSSSRSNVSNGPSMATKLTYHANTGRLNTQIYPTGLKTRYAYTPKGALKQLTLDTAATLNPLPATPGGSPGAPVTLPVGTVLWTATSVNAWGKAEAQTLGNNVVSRASFDPLNGRVLSASAGVDAARNVLDHSYAWDALNNLTQRIDANGDGSTGAVTESYVYDSLNRLTDYTVAAPQVPNLARTVTLAYNAIGNLLYKSDVGNYSYPAFGNDALVTRPRPHGVTQVVGPSIGTISYSYDANGNVTGATGGKYRSIAYTSFNLPDSQSGVAGPAGSPRSTWQYDENHQRIKETRVNGAGTRTTWYLHPDNQGGLGFESETAPSGAVSNRHYLNAGGQMLVLVSTGALPVLGGTQTSPPAISSIALVKLEYWHKDHLGSIAATTDHAGNVTARFAYDPFGKRRQTNGQYDAFGTLVIDWADNVNHGTDRGFTGHEHLDDLGLVHMNGRLYDPLIARFLQGDPFIQAPDELQNYNRYSYCYNNPLNCTDPTGYISFKKLFKMVAAVVVSYFTAGAATNWLLATELGCTVTGSAIANALGAAAGGFAAGAIQGGSFKAGMQGAFSAALFFGVGQAIGSNEFSSIFSTSESRFFGAVAMHGVAGCVSSVAGGGKCGPGALSAAFSKAITFTSAMQEVSARAHAGDSTAAIGGAMVSAVAGGTASVLGGGKFANGAMTGAFSYLFNDIKAARDAERSYRVEVLIGHPDINYSTEGFLDKVSSLGGHAAIVIDGIVYSKVGGGMMDQDGLTRDRYLQNQDFRSTTSVSFNATLGEIMEMSRYLNSAGSHGQRSYSVFLSNCADAVAGALRAGGIIAAPPPFPLYSPRLLHQSLMFQIQRPTDRSILRASR